jgi:hypothetical protein
MQTAGRSSIPKIRQRLSVVNWMQRIPAGLPPGIPGIGEEIDGAMQQAPQPGRHFIIPSPEVALPGLDFFVRSLACMRSSFLA